MQLDPKERVVVAHMGEHILEEGADPVHVYAACREPLLHRWGRMWGLRSCVVGGVRTLLLLLLFLLMATDAAAH